MDNFETKPNSAEDQKANKGKQITFAKAFSLAIQFAFIILIPLFVFGSFGKWLQNRDGNKLWLIAGLLLALTTTVLWFYRKLSDLYKDFID